MGGRGRDAALAFCICSSFGERDGKDSASGSEEGCIAASF